MEQREGNRDIEKGRVRQDREKTVGETRRQGEGETHRASIADIAGL